MTTPGATEAVTPKQRARQVRVSYDASSFPALDAVIAAAAGRTSDFAGMGMGFRDHGWVCGSEIEAQRIFRALRAIGLRPEIKP